ncbi:MAG TPA: hypothetical protein ENH82_18345 [bacterium]|nr:hypothetical protein [bacterium]
MNILIIITSILVTISFIRDRGKTINGLKIAIKRFVNISISFLVMLILVSLVLFIIPGNMISKYLSNGNKYVGILIALLFGSITMMPGFIAFPLSGILKQNGVLFMIISAFTTTLMMVGVLTFPIEKKYFGTKVAVLRNAVGFIIALIVSIITGIFFGEMF